MQFILIPHYILHCRQCPGSVIIQLFRNKTPVAASSYGTKIGRHIFSACRINYSFVQHSNAAFKLCRRALAHSAAKPRCTSSLKTPFPIWCIAERQSQLFYHDRPIIFFITPCDPAVALSVACRQQIQRRNCQRRPAIRTLLVTLLQKARAVTAFCHDRPIIFFIALCDPAVTLSVVYRQYIQRRNCQRRPAIRTLFVTLLQKQGQSQLFFAMTALSFSLLLCATPPLRYLLPIGNISKGGIVSGDPPSELCLSRYCKSKGNHSFLP